MIVRVSGPPAEATYQSPEGNRILIETGASDAGSHEVSRYLFCNRALAHDRLGSLHSRPKGHLLRGSIMHVGFAHHYARRAVRFQGSITYNGVTYTNPDAFYSPLEAQRVLVGIKMSPSERKAAKETDPDNAESLSILDKCQATLTKYLQVTNDMFRVLAIEDPQRVELPGGIQHTARVDLCVREIDGVYFDDFKSNTQSIERASRMYRNSLQLLALNIFGRQQYGNDFRGVRAVVVSQDTGKATRVPINAPCLINDMPAMLQHVRGEMRRSQALYGDNARAYPPTGVAFSCLDPNTGALCEYSKLCSFGE